MTDYKTVVARNGHLQRYALHIETLAEAERIAGAWRSEGQRVGVHQEGGAAVVPGRQVLFCVEGRGAMRRPVEG